MKHIKRLGVMIIGAALVVAACGTPPSPVATPSGPHVVMTPGALDATPVLDGVPLSMNLSAAQAAAQRALNAATNVPPDQIRPIITEPMQWPDSCLGTQQTGIQCAQQIVPGFRVVLEANGHRYEYHTNEDGSSIVLAAEVSPYVRVAVLSANNAIVVADSPVVFDPQTVVELGGLQPLAGAADSTVYALLPGDVSSVVEFKAGETRPIEFVKNPSNGLAVWTSDTGGLPRLSWGTSLAGGNLTSALWVSTLDGSDLTNLVSAPAGAQPVQLVAQRWASDGQSIFYSQEPGGPTAYDPFAGASSLYRVNLADRAVSELLAYNPTAGRTACLDDITPDGRLVAHHCDGARISISDLGGGLPKRLIPPVDAIGVQRAGSARFDPSMSRLAYALSAGNGADTRGWVALSDDLSGASQLVLASNPGEYLTVIGWLTADTLLIQARSTQCTPACNSVWTVGVDGNGLTKVADGTFLTVLGSK